MRHLSKIFCSKTSSNVSFPEISRSHIPSSTLEIRIYITFLREREKPETILPVQRRSSRIINPNAHASSSRTYNTVCTHTEPTMHCACPHPTVLPMEPILPVTPILETPPSGEQGTETLLPFLDNNHHIERSIYPQTSSKSTSVRSEESDARTLFQRRRRVFASYISNTVIRNKRVCHYATVR